MARCYTEKTADIWNGVQRQYISARYVSTGRSGSSRRAVFLKRAAASWRMLSYQDMADNRSLEPQVRKFRSQMSRLANVEKNRFETWFLFVVFEIFLDDPTFVD